MIRALARKMMDAEVEVACGADYGEVSPARGELAERLPAREWDARAGLVDRVSE
jgi:putative transposase